MVNEIKADSRIEDNYRKFILTELTKAHMILRELSRSSKLKIRHVKAEIFRLSEPLITLKAAVMRLKGSSTESLERLLENVKNEALLFRLRVENVQTFVREYFYRPFSTVILALLLCISGLVLLSSPSILILSIINLFLAIGVFFMNKVAAAVTFLFATVKLLIGLSLPLIHITVNTSLITNVTGAVVETLRTYMLIDALIEIALLVHSWDHYY